MFSFFNKTRDFRWPRLLKKKKKTGVREFLDFVLTTKLIFDEILDFVLLIKHWVVLG